MLSGVTSLRGQHLGPKPPRWRSGYLTCPGVDFDWLDPSEDQEGRNDVEDSDWDFVEPQSLSFSKKRSVCWHHRYSEGG